MHDVVYLRSEYDPVTQLVGDAGAQRRQAFDDAEVLRSVRSDIEHGADAPINFQGIEKIQHRNIFWFDRVFGANHLIKYAL